MKFAVRRRPTVSRLPSYRTTRTCHHMHGTDKDLEKGARCASKSEARLSSLASLPSSSYLLVYGTMEDNKDKSINARNNETIASHLNAFSGNGPTEPEFR